MEQPLRIWIDGAARGNPGPASSGGVVKLGDTVVAEWGIPLGVLTNNAAEYYGLVFALLYLSQHIVQKVTIHSDSKLLVEQVNGRWKVKAPQLVPYFQLVQPWLKEYPHVKLIDVRREFNRDSDALANRALDEKRRICVNFPEHEIDPVMKKIKQDLRSTLF